MISERNLFSLRKTVKNILYLTDIHLDLLYDSDSPFIGEFIFRCKHRKNLEDFTAKPYDYGRFYCNSNENLLKVTLGDVKKKYNDVTAIIISGDQIAHGLSDLDLNKTKEENKILYKKTFSTIYYHLKQTYPNATIITAIGNNDFYQHYDFMEESSRLEQISFLKSLYFETFDPQYFNSDFNETISNAFYYSQYEPNLNVKFIVLNTVILSLKNQKKSLSDEIAWKQFDFLERELKLAKKGGQSVILIFHIPPFAYYVGNKVEFFYFEEYSQKMEKVIYDFKNIIINVFTGHIHTSKVGVRSRLVGNFLPQKNVDSRFGFAPRSVEIDNYFSSVSFPSLTPIFSNNPGYSIVKFNPEFLKIEEIEIHHADLKKTLNEDMTLSRNVEISPENLFSIKYSFKKDFGFFNFDNSDFYNFISNRINDSEILSKYIMFTIGARNSNEEKDRNISIEIMKKGGLIDIENGYKIFKCVNKIFYSKEIDTC
jgi:hypothetical protein